MLGKVEAIRGYWLLFNVYINRGGDGVGLVSDVVSSEDMMVWDENSAYMGVSRLMLMENAGAAVARQLISHLGQAAGKKVLVLCGPGNNGGDGFAAARHLACMGADVTVFLLAEPERIRTVEARVNFEAVQNMRASLRLFVVDTVERLLELANVFEDVDAVVDAVLGTGAKPGLPDLYKTAIKLANTVNCTRLAVDLPTGLDTDTGEGETYFEPDIIVALHMKKPVHQKFIEKTVVEPIGMPPEAAFLAGPGQLKLLLKKIGLGKLSSARLAYVFGEKGPIDFVRDFLTGLKGATAFCDLNMLVENPELRYAVASSRAVLLSPDVSPSSIKPFLPRSQPIVLTAPTGFLTNPIYVLWSDKPMLQDFRDKHRDYLKDVEELCRKLAAPVYVVGEVDMLSNGVKSLANWLGKPIKQSHFPYAAALVAWFISSGADPLLSMASASYLLRSAELPILENPKNLADHVHSSIERLA